MRKKLQEKYEDKTLHAIVAVVFAFVAIFHLVRIAFGLPLTVGLWNVSLWISFIAVIVTVWLSMWAWKAVEADKHTKKRKKS